MRHIQLITFTLACSLAMAASAQSQGFFWWNVDVSNAERVAAANTPSFVLYGMQTSLNLKWVFKNDEGDQEMTVVPSALQTGVTVNVTSQSGPIGATLSWAVSGAWVSSGMGVPVSSQETVTLKPGDWIEWNAVVSRADSVTWNIGEYQLSIDMTAALPALRTDGKQWRGRSAPTGTLTFRVLEDATLRSRKARQRLEGRRAFEDGRFAAAVEQYKMLVQTDPGDPGSYADLGHALIAVGQYRDAAAALEIALPLGTRGEKSLITEWLAYAYVQLRDDNKALRVLRLVNSENDARARLESLRRRAGRR